MILGSTLILAVRQTEVQTEYSLDVKRYPCNHSTLSVSIFPEENKSWWQPSYLNATLRGIAQWNDAIQEFASNHTEFSYLSRISLVPTITHENVSGFDIYIGWIGECGECETSIGQSQKIVNPFSVTIKNTIRLSAKAPSGHVMTEVDMQNIVVHELGHTFDLSHSTYSGDVMYFIVQYRETVKPLSSLDIYALSQNYEWMSNSNQFTSSNMYPQESSVTLPSRISYYHIPITAENLPSPTPQSFIEYTTELFLRPEILTTILSSVSLLVVAAIIIKNKKFQINP